MTISGHVYGTWPTSVCEVHFSTWCISVNKKISKWTMLVHYTSIYKVALSGRKGCVTIEAGMPPQMHTGLTTGTGVTKHRTSRTGSALSPNLI